ncbi:VOC family protein [Pseudomonas psychrophila]|uniref:VOC family protein n=1 Tax=Pseudomonas psychrophila TaxID=122355 RepID=A0A8I1KBX0_9PSED|nr:VOC family protein [Pseudomonas psychrophila]
MQSLFHFAYHVHDLVSARSFYCDVLGCAEGRSTDTWLDIDFFGHQLSLHLGESFSVSNTGKVGDHWVPMPHFGVVLSMPDWLVLKQRLVERGVDFVLEPTFRFVGTPGEQATMFFLDPSGNPVEIKGFAEWAAVYAQ